MMNEKEDQKNFVLTDDLDLCYDYSLFSGLNRTQLKEVRKLCREECFYPGHTLFKEECGKSQDPKSDEI